MKQFNSKLKNMQNMNKKIYQLILLLLFSMPGLMAQTLKIHDVVESPGVISVQVDMNGFPSVGAITLEIAYDGDLLSFTGIENTSASLNGMWSDNSTFGKIKIAFFGSGSQASGKLLDLKFTYNGGFSSDLNFVAGCEIADGDLDVLQATFQNGSVSQLNPDNNAIYMEPPAAGVLVGNTATVPVKIDGTEFINVDAITLKIAFDQNQLAYTGKTDNAVSFTANASGGMLTLQWSSLNPQDFTSETLLTSLDFTYLGGGDASLEFVSGCVVTYDNDPFAVDYTDGLIVPYVGDEELEIATINGTPGTNVTVPITASGFDTSEVGAITLKIGYDPAKLTYTGYESFQPATGWSVSASGGVLTMQRTNLDGFTIDDNTLVAIDFDYHGGGSAPVVFNPGTIIETTSFVVLPVNLKNGAVDPAIHDASLTIGQVASYTGSQVQVPVYAAGFGATTIGSITLKIGFPAGDLVFTGATSSTAGWKVGSTSNQASLKWSNQTGTTLPDDELVVLNFVYHGTGVTPVVFNPGVIITEPGPDYDLVPITMYDGHVSTTSELSIRVFLEGPYDTGSGQMNTTLQQNGLVPNFQPYSAAPWNFNIPENVTAIPAGIVDWVLVELRDASTDTDAATDPSTTVWKGALFLKEDGYLTALDGVSDPVFPTANIEDGLFIVVRHRNHLDVMSSSYMTLNGAKYEYDFTDDEAKAFKISSTSVAHKLLKVGVYGMPVGDADGNGVIGGGDFGVWSTQTGILVPGYYNADFTFSGIVGGSDFLRWAVNSGINNPILKSYSYMNDSCIFNGKAKR
jgi:hypothetical protein